MHAKPMKSQSDLPVVLQNLITKALFDHSAAGNWKLAVIFARDFSQIDQPVVCSCDVLQAGSRCHTDIMTNAAVAQSCDQLAANRAFVICRWFRHYLGHTLSRLSEQQNLETCKRNYKEGGVRSELIYPSWALAEHFLGSTQGCHCYSRMMLASCTAWAGCGTS